jgi:hypothetical protein
MKKFLIRSIVTHYTPVGAHDYAVEFPVFAKGMSRERAARAVISFLLRSDPPEVKETFLRKLLQTGSVFIPRIDRIVAAVSWEDTGEETEPIILTLSDGLIENIAGIPDGHHIEIRDWDADEVDENGNSTPEVTVWKHDGQWAPGCH